MFVVSSGGDVTDLFCGAGGTTTGAKAAGATVKVAVNHWKRAVTTHNTNHPEVEHVLTDISTADPRRFPKTDMLCASPECTNMTLAKGKARKHQAQLGLWESKAPDPAEERSRCTMFDPLRFAEEHRYPIVLLENVLEVRYWVMYEAWLHAWKSLGYRWEFVYFNSMFAHPTPQSRDRWYFVAWREGNPKPDLRYFPRAYCEHCGKDVLAVQSWKNPQQPWGKYGRNGQYLYCCPACNRVVTPYYYAAANAIDWSLPAQRIGDRKHALKAKTMRRIEEGLRRFSEPVIVPTNHGERATRTQSVLAPLPTQTAWQELGMAYPPPFLVHLNKSDFRALDVLHQPMPTQTTRNGLGLVLPFIAELHGTSAARSVTEPLSTVCAGGNHHGLVLPSAWWLNYNRNGSLHPVSDPLGTLPTHDRFALVQPGKTLSVEECYFRMLTPEEIKAAMAFPSGYIVTGTKREQVKQLGNACTPPVMQWLLERCLASLN
jgi:DNA (cytosine-5)-methyltransferase 1